MEELLRYDGPIGAQVRIAQAPQALHGKQLNPGDRVFLLMNAANRDPRAYPDPDRVDLARNGVPHLTFGFGAHICLGFPLARLEARWRCPRCSRAGSASSWRATRSSGWIRWCCAA